LPTFCTYYKLPVKMVETPDGGMAAWRLDPDTGGWESVNEHIDEMLFAVGGDDRVLSQEKFVQLTELNRGRSLKGEGPIFALYETVNAITDLAYDEERPLTPEERALVEGIRRKTFVMFEEQLQQAGDPAADPSLAE
jgi:hypothetical protein